LPLIAVFSYVGDGIWLIIAFDPTSESQHNYAGLASTLLILFYYLQYDVEFKHAIVYFFYQLVILVGVVAGDVLNAYYYTHMVPKPYIEIIFYVFCVMDALFVITVYILKDWYEYRVTMGVSVHNLFHLMSRLEVLLIVLIPMFTTYDVITSNTIAFFVLYEFFSNSYNNPDLAYNFLWCLSFWALIVFSTATVVCENFEFVYYLRSQKNNSNTNLLLPYRSQTSSYSSSAGSDDNEKYSKIAENMDISAKSLEVIATFACYTLLILQFFPKAPAKQRTFAQVLERQKKRWRSGFFKKPFLSEPTPTDADELPVNYFA
jgi:hypothetical protein